jgi:hypothetical protein
MGRGKKIDVSVHWTQDRGEDLQRFRFAALSLCSAFALQRFCFAALSLCSALAFQRSRFAALSLCSALALQTW